MRGPATRRVAARVVVVMPSNVRMPNEVRPRGAWPEAWIRAAIQPTAHAAKIPANSQEMSGFNCFYAVASRACAKSAIRSSVFSMPQDSRIMLSEMPNCGGLRACIA